MYLRIVVELDLRPGRYRDVGRIEPQAVLADLDPDQARMSAIRGGLGQRCTDARGQEEKSAFEAEHINGLSSIRGCRGDSRLRGAKPVLLDPQRIKRNQESLILLSDDAYAVRNAKALKKYATRVAVIGPHWGRLVQITEFFAGLRGELESHASVHTNVLFLNVFGSSST